MGRAYLIVGLGNPGKAYEKTRHNLGFLAVERIARVQKWELRKKFLLKGRLARGEIEGKSVYLLEPTTFMNLSGVAVAQAMRKYHIAIEDLLVIVDDVALPFGQLRLRSHSGSGGHNGLKNIEDNLKTNGYARLRIGVGEDRSGDLAEHVLSPFSPAEQKLVPEILERAANIVKMWLTEGLTSAMNHANAKNE
ncbi:MAG: pth [Parachlamydiales bacterium]|nr:pth [Parachlamydiales bacterium]